MRKRLRPAYSPDELAAIYPAPHQHNRWRDHVLRVNLTVEVCRWFTPVRRAADLSCGDGAILQALDAETRIFGDFAPGYDICGPIEDTVRDLGDVDLFVCSETLEHLDDPDAVLWDIRARTSALVLSTPVGEIHEDRNPEHYWGWDEDGVELMLHKANFTPEVFTLLRVPGLDVTYQIWGCR